MKIQGKSISKKCRVLLLVMTCVMASLLFLDICANAENIKIGTVINLEGDSRLNFRSGPGTTYSKVGYLQNGDSGQILEEATATNDVIWYKMRIDGVTGWASSAYIKVTEQAVTEDEAFEVYLTQQGFPESYKSQLHALHNIYPNWVFEAQHTNLDWDKVIKAESALGKNLVHKDSISSWKSTQSGAYDWETGQWVNFDSGGWVMASNEMIQYCMDPRNFLDSTNIFQFIKQSYDVSVLSDKQIELKKIDLTNMVASTYLAGKCDGSTYIDIIMEVAAETGVDPFTLASMMIQEQGVNGTGNSISGTVAGYEGYYNYFNIGAYQTGTMSAVERGLWYAKGADTNATTYGRPWNTRTRSIMGGALYYGTNYVNVGQDTLYLKKFNVQGSNIYEHQYMTNVQGAASEGQHVAKGYDENARKAALIFKIPVYKNMPEGACMKPTGNDNPNYMLKSLSVEGQSLTPTFSIYETTYSAIVENSVSSVTISAQAVAGTTSVSGTGTVKLNVGENVFKITTKAENGSTRTYTITIVREEASTPQPPEVVVKVPSLTSSSYKVNSNNTITGITNFPISTTEFVKQLIVENGSVKITNSNGTVKTGNVGTGDRVNVYDTAGTLKFTYNILIYGDANGDGRINAQDLLVIQKNNIRVSALSGVNYTAADVNRDGRVNAQDLLLVQKHNIKIKSIQQ